MKIVVDIVPNHTSNMHEWFQAALAAEPGSPERDRYIFREGRGEHGELPPNDWQSLFGGPAWQRVADGQWYLHIFTVEQPDLNWKNPEVHEDFKKTLRFWSDRGVDGFRIDVAHGLAKDLDSKPLAEMGADCVFNTDNRNGDNPLWDRPEVHDIYREWNAVFNEYQPARFAVGEAWVIRSTSTSTRAKASSGRCSTSNSPRRTGMRRRSRPPSKTASGRHTTRNRPPPG